MSTGIGTGTWYTVKRLQAPNATRRYTLYQVTKWGDFGNEPLEHYDVTYPERGDEDSQQGLCCNCRGYRHTPGYAHKHVMIVVAHRKLNEPELVAYWLEGADPTRVQFFPMASTVAGAIPRKKEIAQPSRPRRKRYVQRNER